MQVIFGSIVSPFTGPVETRKGRFTIYQEVIPFLDNLPEDTPVDCRLFGPPNMLLVVRARLGIDYDPDYIEPCLLFKGDTGTLIKRMKEIFEDLEELNSDDDEIFKNHLAN